MLSRDDKELRKAVNEVNSQIESLNALQKKSEKDLKKRIQALNAQVEQGIEDATQQANTAISDFLKKGAVNIAAVLRGELDEELKHLKFYKTSSSLERENILQNLLDTLPPNLKRSQTILAQLRGNKYKTLDEIKLFFFFLRPILSEKRGMDLPLSFGHGTAFIKKSRIRTRVGFKFLILKWSTRARMKPKRRLRKLADRSAEF